MLALLGGSGTKNPKTGLLEFFEGSDQADSHGSNSSGMVGGDPGGGQTNGTTGGTTPGEQLADALARGDRVDFSAPMADGGRDEGDRGRAAGRAGGIGGFNDTRGLLDRVGDYFSTKANDARANPFATAINLGFGLLANGTPLGWGNTLSGLVNGPTVGSLSTAAARGLSGYESTPGGLLDSATNPSGSKDSPLDPNGQNDARGGNDPGASPASGTGGPLSQQTASDVARGALARALVTGRAAPNLWDANRFVSGSNAGAPDGYNSWNGNQFVTPGGMTYGPGLVSSFDPNGRQYVTRWGYGG